MLKGVRDAEAPLSMGILLAYPISILGLSRKLRDENVAFSEVLEETRAALARRYLAERDLPVSEIAWLLGYGEVSSFTHAFKRWTGMTPRQFRLTP